MSAAEAMIWIAITTTVWAGMALASETLIERRTRR